MFPARRTRTVADVGLPENATDAAIVEKAWKPEAIIVTANGDDFLREVRRFLRSTKRKDCHDLFGLVILPNKYEIQKRTLNELNVRAGEDDWKSGSHSTAPMLLLPEGRFDLNAYSLVDQRALILSMGYSAVAIASAMADSHAGTTVPVCESSDSNRSNLGCDMGE
jgi:hypothetical protein